MDELTTLREFRAETPHPDPASTAAARRRLRATMSGDTKTRNRFRSVAIPLTAAAAVVAVIVAMPRLGAGDRPGGYTSTSEEMTARVALEAVARIAERQDGTRPADRTYWYSRSDLADATYDEPAGAQGGVGRYLQHREDWRHGTSNGRIVIVDGETIWVQAGEGEQVNQAPPTSAPSRPAPAPGDDGGEIDVKRADAPLDDTNVTPGYHWNLGDGEITLAELDALPTDAAGLAVAMRDLARKYERPGTTGQAWMAAQILGGMPASPALRAALYRHVAGLPGVRALGPVSTVTGPRGSGFAVGANGTDVRLVVDEGTSRLVAWEVRPPAGTSGVPADGIAKFQVWHVQGWVTHQTDRVETN